MRVYLQLPAVALVCVAGCADVRDREVGPACESWRDEVQSALADCIECHAGVDPAGDYDLSSYLGALGAGTDDVANAIAGDPSSELLAYLDPASADGVHASVTSDELFALVQRWTVDCELSYARSAIHAGGLLNPADDEEFHGRLLLDSGWDFDLCASCHGEDFTGGTSGAACTGCHPDGPTTCDTCHEASPTTGAHVAHLTAGPLDKRYDCTTCHVVPAAYDDVGHILDGDGMVDGPPAEIAFGPAAGDSPVYDPNSARCSDVYCHGATLADTAGTNTAPVWTEPGTGQADCGTCHGIAPASHADDRCAVCHPTVVAADLSFVDTALHIDAMLQIGRGTGDCTDCHGDDTGPAPPPDLEGNTTRGEVTVGAHSSHVDALHDLRGPIPCTDCHVEPSALDDPGHIDTGAPAEVFPGAFGGLAAARGAAPGWDRATATCSDVYCHGGGALSDDKAVTIDRVPVWTETGFPGGCGTCHGAPPDDSMHLPTFILQDCVSCHPNTVDAFGNILVDESVDPPTSEHIDGTVDLL